MRRNSGQQNANGKWNSRRAFAISAVPLSPFAPIMSNPILVDFTRGTLVESMHRGAAAVSDALGRLLFSVGDVERPIFPRSALKPIQAVPLVESGAADAYRLSDEELALACASHSGEPMHTTRVLAWL